MTADNIHNKIDRQHLSLGTRIQLWCTRNPWPTVIIGGMIVGIGLLIDISYDLYFSDKYPDLNLIATILSHLFIILGEATMVTFFLHLFVEHKVQADHLTYMNTLLQSEMDAIQRNVGNIMNNFSNEVDKNVSIIKKNLLAALLEEKMPHEIVKLILENDFFTTDVLRRNLVVTYKFKKAEDEILEIEQTVQFDLKNILAKEKYNYKMAFSISDTPLATYRFSDASFRKYNEHGKLSNKVCQITIDDLFKPDETNSGKYILKEAIEIEENESIKVFQSFISTYKIDGIGFIDNYYVNTHTINACIEFELPIAYEIEVYPTFPEKFLSDPIIQGGKKTYENIPFLVPGQGFSFSIKRKH